MRISVTGEIPADDEFEMEDLLDRFDIHKQAEPNTNWNMEGF